MYSAVHARITRCASCSLLACIYSPPLFAIRSNSRPTCSITSRFVHHAARITHHASRSTHRAARIAQHASRSTHRASQPAFSIASCASACRVGGNSSSDSCKCLSCAVRKRMESARRSSASSGWLFVLADDCDACDAIARSIHLVDISINVRRSESGAAVTGTSAARCLFCCLGCGGGAEVSPLLVTPSSSDSDSGSRATFQAGGLRPWSHAM